MPWPTNRTRLSPNPPPDVPPWRWLPPRVLARWLGVSMQAATNWRQRGTWPRYRIAKNGRVWYRASDVLAWLAQSEPGEASDKSWLANHQTQLDQWGGEGLRLQSDRDEVAALLAKGVAALADDEVERLAGLADRARVFGNVGKTPKRFLSHEEAMIREGYI